MKTLQLLSLTVALAGLSGQQALAQSKEDVPDLIKDLKSKDENVRIKAAIELGKIGEDATAAIPALTAALKDGSDEVRGFSIAALGSMKKEAKSAVPGII